MTRSLYPAIVILALAIGGAFPTASYSQSTDETTDETIVEAPQEVERWFGALGSVNRSDFDELIADGAIIALKDLGVDQTKQEFIDALDEWEKTTRGANIVYRYEAIEDDSATVLVCYRFTSNEQLNLEKFTFSNGQITGSIQEFKGVDCADM